MSSNRMTLGQAALRAALAFAFAASVTAAVTAASISAARGEAPTLADRPYAVGVNTLRGDGTPVLVFHNARFPTLQSCNAWLTGPEFEGQIPGLVRYLQHNRLTLVDMPACQQLPEVENPASRKGREVPV